MLTHEFEMEIDERPVKVGVSFSYDMQEASTPRGLQQWTTPIMDRVVHGYWRDSGHAFDDAERSSLHKAVREGFEEEIENGCVGLEYE